MESNSRKVPLTLSCPNSLATYVCVFFHFISFLGCQFQLFYNVFFHLAAAIADIRKAILLNT